nr:hypothetical protein [uncultured Flavobacterium sp.]
MENNHPNIKEETDFNDFQSKSINKEEGEKIIEQLTEPLVDNKEQLAEALTDDLVTLTEPVIDTLYYDFVNKPQKVDILKEWEEDFTQRMYIASKSNNQNYSMKNALKCKQHHTERDKCFIIVYNFLRENPPERNDIIKYLNCYIIYGKKLQQKYCKYDAEVLEKYYKKADEKKKDGDTYNPFSIPAYRTYVIYMVLKLQDQYLKTDDDLFNVTFTDNREYNPLTKIPSILRGFLPIPIVEYDIKRAFPTFIDMELGTDHRDECYEKLEKKTYAKALNANSIKKNNDYYYKRIIDLEKIYGGRAVEVLTEERFYEKGRAFKDFAKYEKEFVELFIKKNNENQ